MKKRKFNILLNIAVLCMCVCAIAIGVYSAKTASLNVSGTIGFTAHNCKVRVLGKITGAVNASNVALDPATTPALNYYDSTDNTKGKLIDGTADSWNFDKIYFDDLNAEGDAIATDIVFTFTLTNESNAYDVIATLNVDNLPSNVKPAVTFSTGSNNSGFVCELKKDKTAVTMTLTLSLLTSENISAATKNLDLTLSFDRVNQNQTSEALGYTFSNGTIKGVPATSESNATLNIPSYFYDSTNGVKFVNTFVGFEQQNKSIENANSYSSIIIPSSATEIGVKAFLNCTNLTAVTIPNGVTTIGEYVFSGCTGLTKITIPNSVTTIGEGAFMNCSKLTIITISSSVTTIYDWVFSNCTNLTTIIIPSDVTSIGANAFANCSNLTTITIPNSVITIGSQAFIGCTKLTTITIPSSVITIGSEVFSLCNKLATITFEKTDNWQYSADNKTYTDLSAAGMSLTNPADNSIKFKGAWKNYYFRQKTAN